MSRLDVRAREWIVQHLGHVPHYADPFGVARLARALQAAGAPPDDAELVAVTAASLAASAPPGRPGRDEPPVDVLDLLLLEQRWRAGA